MTRKTLDQTLGFLRSLDRTASAEDVARLLLIELADVGVTHVIAGTVPPHGMRTFRMQDHILLNTYPVEWSRRYVSRNYVHHDPTVRRLGTVTTPFAWRDVRNGYPEDPLADRVMNEAADFRLRDGIMLPLQTPDRETAGISVSGERLCIEPGDHGMLQLIATCAFGRLLLLSGRGSGSGQVRLAPREREALQWAAEGKTDWEIGEVMGISLHGVDFHLRSARTKLGTSSRTQAVAIALRQGLII